MLYKYNAMADGKKPAQMCRGKIGTKVIFLLGFSMLFIALVLRYPICSEMVITCLPAPKCCGNNWRLRAEQYCWAIYPRLRLYFGLEKIEIPGKEHDPSDDFLDRLLYIPEYPDLSPFKEIRFLQRTQKREALAPLFKVINDYSRHRIIREDAAWAVRDIHDK